MQMRVEKKHKAFAYKIYSHFTQQCRIEEDWDDWLWKSEIGNFHSLDLERVLIYQKKYLWKNAIFHSIKLQFDAEVAEKNLNVI